MKFSELVKKRRTCRNFDIEKKVDDKFLDAIIEAGLQAPTGMNSQNVIIICIKNKEIRDKISLINAAILNTKTDPFYGAPIIFIVASKKSPLSIYDGSAAMENMLLQATELGLSSAWIHRAKEELENEEVIKLLNLNDIDLHEYEGIGHVIVGYEKEDNIKPKTIKGKRVFLIE